MVRGAGEKAQSEKGKMVKIGESKFNRWYKEVKGEEVPK